MKHKLLFITSIVFFALFILLIILLKNVDISETGIKGTAVGLSTINYYFKDLIGENLLFYVITDWVGIIGIVVAFCFGMIGFKQLIQRKKLFKVDFEILILGALYIIMILGYLFFEKIIINFRPVLLGDNPEASFPSSHTFITCTIMFTSIPLIKKYFLNKSVLKKVLIVFNVAVIAITIIGRIMSGVHWITDILGGILLSVALTTIYFFAIKEYRR